MAEKKHKVSAERRPGHTAVILPGKSLQLEREWLASLPAADRRKVPAAIRDFVLHPDQARAKDRERQARRVRKRWRPPGGTVATERDTVMEAGMLEAPRPLTSAERQMVDESIDRLEAMLRGGVIAEDATMLCKAYRALGFRGPYGPGDTWKGYLEVLVRDSLVHAQGSKAAATKNPFPNGRAILRELARVSPPEDLTAAKIDRALRRSTLGPGGGRGALARANYQTVVADLISEVEKSPR